MLYQHNRKMPMMMPMVMAALCSWSNGESTLRCLMVKGTTAAAAAGVVVMTAVVGDVVAAAAAIGAASVVVLFDLCGFWSLNMTSLDRFASNKLHEPDAIKLMPYSIKPQISAL